VHARPGLRPDREAAGEAQVQGLDLARIRGEGEPRDRGAQESGNAPQGVQRLDRFAAPRSRSAKEARRMHDSSTCPICRGLPVGGSMSDDDFFAFLAACRDELAAKQAGFQQRIAGAPRWQYELADGSLTIGGTRFGMTPIGSFS